ncbi:MAG: signal peptide-containing protein [Planctomycetota bacterium]|nr:signal peptide-containing protein [Planctomycetota bacterium]
MSPKSENFRQVEEKVMGVGYLKYCVAGCVGVILVGGAIFGNELFSYLRTSTGAVRESVREAVPIEFELQRARDLIDEILPEIHANVRLIAEDEVEIAALENDLVRSSKQLVTDRRLLSQLRGKLDTQNVSYEIGDRRYSRKQLAEQAALKLARLKDAEMIQASKQRLLENRQKSLQAAMQMLDRARNRKAELEQKVESLVAQHRLVKASSIGSRFHVDDSKLSKADRLLSDIQKRVDVSERVLAHDSISEITMEDVLDEDELLAEIDDHLGHGSTDDVEVAKLEAK